MRQGPSTHQLEGPCLWLLSMDDDSPGGGCHHRSRGLAPRSARRARPVVADRPRIAVPPPAVRHHGRPGGPRNLVMRPDACLSTGHPSTAARGPSRIGPGAPGSVAQGRSARPARSPHRCRQGVWAVRCAGCPRCHRTAVARVPPVVALPWDRCVGPEPRPSVPPFPAGVGEFYSASGGRATHPVKNSPTCFSLSPNGFRPRSGTAVDVGPLACGRRVDTLWTVQVRACVRPGRRSCTTCGSVGT